MKTTYVSFPSGGTNYSYTPVEEVFPQGSIFSGDGEPEGRVYGNKRDMYLKKDVPVTLYIKTEDNSTTGWL